MLRKIGRFEAYIPDRSFFDTFLEILSLTGFKQNEKFDSPLHLLYRFFLKSKGKYPHMFEDVFFNHDPDFPYSEQVEDCLTRLQESGFITRPNPSLNRYRIDVDLSSSKPKRNC